MELTLEGSLSNSSFPELMLKVCNIGKTGVLYLSRKDIRKNIYIEDGKVVFATSSNPDERLGEFLLKANAISYEHLEESAVLIKKENRLGAILADKGYILRDKLPDYVVEQIKQIIFELFQWNSGKYIFEIGSLPSKEEIKLQFSTEEIILEGIKKINKWSLIKDGVGNLDNNYTVLPDGETKKNRLPLTSDENNIIDLVKKFHNLRDILRNTGLGCFSTCQLLWAFQITGIIKKSENLITSGKQNKEDKKEIIASPSITEKIASRISAEKIREHPLSSTKTEQHPQHIDLSDEYGDDDIDNYLQQLDGTENINTVTTEESEKKSEKTFKSDIEVKTPVLELSSDIESLTAEQTAPPESAKKDNNAIVTIFNKRHSYLYKFLRGTKGEETKKFIQTAISSLDAGHRKLFDSLTINDDGTFPPNLLLERINVMDIRFPGISLTSLIRKELEMAKLIINENRLKIIELGLKKIKN